MFSIEFCEIFKGTFFIEYLWTTASNVESVLYRNISFLWEERVLNLFLTIFRSRFVKYKSVLYFMQNMFIHVDASKGYDQIGFTLPFVFAVLIIIWNLHLAA